MLIAIPLVLLTQEISFILYLFQYMESQEILTGTSRNCAYIERTPNTEEEIKETRAMIFNLFHLMV